MNQSAMDRAADILLVTSNRDEVSQLQTAIRRAKIKNRLHHVGNAVEALAYLWRHEPYANAPMPGLVLVDLDLPSESVVELLRSIRIESRFPGISVVAIADQSADVTLIAEYLRSVDGIIQKPFTLRKLAESVCDIENLSFLLLRADE